MKKRILALFLALSICLTMAACAGTKTPTETTKAAETEPAATSTSAPVEETTGPRTIVDMRGVEVTLPERIDRVAILDKGFLVQTMTELFARELYADWDGFCQRCVTDVLEEFFYRYDKKDIYMEIGRLADGHITFYNLDGDEIEKELVEIKWDAKATEKGGYEHFMMKEIHEQPKAVKDTLNSVLKDGKLDLSAVELTDDEIKKISQIYIVACGSAYHVGVVAQYVMEDLAKIPVRVELASEFRYRKPLLDPDGLVIVISQSGETADSLAALRLAKDKGLKTLGIVNVVGSSIAREADNVFYTLAGPEIAVATTKAYSTQLIAAYCLALQFAYVRGEMELSGYERLLSELETIPEKIEKILEDKERILWFAAKVANSKDIGLSKEDILKKLEDKLNISLQKAQEYLVMFGKQTSSR